MTLDTDNMLSLARSLSLNLDVLGEEKGTNLEGDTLWHVAHDKFNVLGHSMAASLQGFRPINVIDVPLSWVEVLFEGEIFVQHSQ